MNANFGIYGMAELSSAGNTYATTGGQFEMPMTIIGAGGTAPNQALGAEHSQPFHAYVMGIPGLKICTAATPEGARGCGYVSAAQQSASDVQGVGRVRVVLKGGDGFDLFTRRARGGEFHP